MLEDVLDLYSQIAQAIPEDRNALEREVLEKHNEYVDNMKDLMNYNHFIGMVLLPDIYAEWKNDWNTWPLSFLLYHDFIQRFPDYKNLDAVKEDLKSSLTNDIQYIRSTASQSRVLKIEKEILLSKIKKLVENKYPGMINEIGLEVKVDSLSAF